MSPKTERRITLLAVLLCSFTYFFFLCAKEYTWLFASGDSGDWMAAATWWIVPQPYGSPLFISLGHLVSLLPGSLPLNMTVLLSVIPSSITVTLVFAIVRQMTGKVQFSVTSAVVLAGSAVFLSQSTVLEEYALATMFLTLGIFFYAQGRRKLTALALGLGTAVHIFILPVTVMWLVLHTKTWRVWAAPGIIYLVSGVLPYTLILWLMAYGYPPLVAGGGLSLGAINDYLGSTAVMGSLSVTEAPLRLLYVVMFLLVSFGLAVWPAAKAIPSESKNYLGRMLIVLVGFSVWYYLTSIDPTTWTFLMWGSPAVAILAGLGLPKIGIPLLRKGILAGAICLLIVNGVFLNAELLTKQNPVAESLYQSIWQLPDDVVLVMDRGGPEGLGIFYAMSQGKEITPIFYYRLGHQGSPLYLNYLRWLDEECDIQGYDTVEQIANAMDKHLTVYAQRPDETMPIQLDWKPKLVTEDTGNPWFVEVTGVAR